MRILRSENLHVQAYNIIKESIMNGIYQPGEQLKESKLAEALGTSRGPIREAIRMLVQEGLLVEEGQLRVYHPTFQDLVQLYQCREALESLAARLTTVNISNQELQTLSMILSQTKEAIAKNDRIEMITMNTRFHDTIIFASMNRELIKALQAIRSKVLFMRKTGHLSYFREDSFIEEHEAIFERIQARDAEGAERAMKLHIQKDIEKFQALYEGKSSKNESFLG